MREENSGSTLGDGGRPLAGHSAWPAGHVGSGPGEREGEKGREIAPGVFDSHRNVAHNARGVYVARPSLLEMCVLRINSEEQGEAGGINGRV